MIEKIIREKEKDNIIKQEFDKIEMPDKTKERILAKIIDREQMDDGPIKMISYQNKEAPAIKSKKPLLSIVAAFAVCIIGAWFFVGLQGSEIKPFSNSNSMSAGSSEVSNEATTLDSAILNGDCPNVFFPDFLSSSDSDIENQQDYFYGTHDGDVYVCGLDRNSDMDEYIRLYNYDKSILSNIPIDITDEESKIRHTKEVEMFDNGILLNIYFYNDAGTRVESVKTFAYKYENLEYVGEFKCKFYEREQVTTPKRLSIEPSTDFKKIYMSGFQSEGEIFIKSANLDSGNITDYSMTTLLTDYTILYTELFSDNNDNLYFNYTYAVDNNVVDSISKVDFNHGYANFDIELSTQYDESLDLYRDSYVGSNGLYEKIGCALDGNVIFSHCDLDSSYDNTVFYKFCLDENQFQQIDWPKIEDNLFDNYMIMDNGKSTICIEYDLNIIQIIIYKDFQFDEPAYVININNLDYYIDSLTIDSLIISSSSNNLYLKTSFENFYYIFDLNDYVTDAKYVKSIVK